MNKLLENAQAVIFDADGLLIDSEALWHDTRDEFFKNNHITVDEKYYASFMGRGIRELIELWKEKFGLMGETEDLMDEYRATFYHLAIDAKKLHLMEGAPELILELFHKGKILAIATGGHTRKRMIDMLTIFHLQNYFSEVVSSDSVKKGKPAPDIFLYTQELLQKQKDECVILEDAPNGVEAAKNAEIPVIAVQKGEEFIKEIKKLKPELLVGSLKELL